MDANARTCHLPRGCHASAYTRNRFISDTSPDVPTYGHGPPDSKAATAGHTDTNCGANRDTIAYTRTNRAYAHSNALT